MSLLSALGIFGSSKRDSKKDAQDSELRSMPRGEAQSFSAEAFHEAFERGDYELALRAVESLKHRGKETADYCFYRGSVQMQLGQNQEAQAWLQKSVDLESNANHKARSYSVLGQLLMQQRNFEEAIQCFHAGLQQVPTHASLQRDLAEALLRRGDEPAEALGVARKAVECASQRNSSGGVDPASVPNLAGSLATLAWILAAADGDESEIDQCIKRAVPMVREESVAALAQVHYHSGLAFATLGDRGRSMRHFEEAVLVDPKGLWGRGARLMAHGMSKAG